MIHLKKHILTLALLIAATTGAWAQDYLYLVVDDNGTSATIYYGDPEGYPYLNNGLMQNGTKWDVSVEIRPIIKTVNFDESCQTFNGTSLSGLFTGFTGLTTIKGLDNLRTDDVEDMNSMFEYCSSLTSLDLSSYNTAKVTTMISMFSECSNLTTLDLSSFNTANVKFMIGMFNNCTKLETIYVSNSWSTTQVEQSGEMFYNCASLPGYLSTNPEDKQMATLTTDGGFLTYETLPTPVALPATDDMNSTLSLTQPAGNVTVSVKYFQQAKFTHGGEPAAISGVQANTDNPIVTAGTVKNITGTTTPSGTVMYYASTTALSDAELLALSADKWSSDVPKATNLGQGSAYVYYYILGAEPDNVADRTDANTCSDSDIKAANVVNVTLLAPPAYDVSLNKTGLATGEPDLWKAKSDSKSEVVLGTKDLEGVTPGETVTVTYTGSRKVIGVKAEKKPAAEGHALASAVYGEIIGSDGKAYAAVEKNNLPKGVTAIAMVSYADGTGHGLALALSDEGEMNWDAANTTAAAHTPVISGCIWKLASQYDWDMMINGTDNTILRTRFESVGGNNLKSGSSDRYWSSNAANSTNAWVYNFSNDTWSSPKKDTSCLVRACLAF